MPNRTIYIRKKDLELWDACPNKSELVSRALNMPKYPSLKDVGETVTVTSNMKLVPVVGAICKEHGISKQDCKLMKHKTTPSKIRL